MFEGIFQPAHLILVMAIVAILFGPKKIPELGRGLGEAIRGFRDAFHATPDHGSEGVKPQPDQPTAIAAAHNPDDAVLRLNAATEPAGRDGVNV